VANTTTANYGWQMPDPGGSANTWGNTLNATTQAIDQQVYTNAQAGVPVGTVTMFAGATPPANWLLCNGQQIDTTIYAKLYAVIGNTYGGVGSQGNFLLPNLQGVCPIGPGTNSSGLGFGLGEVTGQNYYGIGVANLPSHAHGITDLAHNHGVNQWAHAHNIATGSHSHGITTGSHSHSLTVQVLTPSGGGNAAAGAGWAFTNVGTNSVGNLGGNTDTAGNLGGNSDTQTSGVSLNASGTGLSTTQPVGSGAAIEIVPPVICLNFIIKYQ
jgi:microcystin-dependent protein